MQTFEWVNAAIECPPKGGEEIIFRYDGSFRVGYYQPCFPDEDYDFFYIPLEGRKIYRKLFYAVKWMKF